MVSCSDLPPGTDSPFVPTRQCKFFWLILQGSHTHTHTEHGNGAAFKFTINYKGFNTDLQIGARRQEREHMLWTVVGKGGTEELSHSGLRTRSHHESHRLNICRLWWLLGVHFKVYLRKTDYCNTEEPKAKLATIFHKSHTQHENTGIYWPFFSLSPAYNLV